jgi:protein AATF/BFR2
LDHGKKKTPYSTKLNCLLIALSSRRYTGATVSRDNLEDAEDSDDPWARHIDIGDSEEEGEEQDNDSEINRNGVEDEEESEEEEQESGSIEGGDSDDIDLANGISSQDSEDEEDIEGDEEEGQGEAEESWRQDQSSKIRAMLQNTSLNTSNIARGQQADIEKAKAVKIQRQTFDTLLNCRIRLQKAIISTNNMALEENKETASQSVIESAEAAAHRLLENITALRSDLDEARTGQKRKRAHFDHSTPSADIWSQIREQDSEERYHAILEKWSAKTKNTSLSASKGRLNAGVDQKLSDVLKAQIQDTSRLLAKTHTPRSCAPLHLKAGIASSVDIYDG